jgi:hypothetical protein
VGFDFGRIRPGASPKRTFSCNRLITKKKRPGRAPGRVDLTVPGRSVRPGDRGARRRRTFPGIRPSALRRRGVVEVTSVPLSKSLRSSGSRFTLHRDPPAGRSPRNWSCAELERRSGFPDRDVDAVFLRACTRNKVPGLWTFFHWKAGEFTESSSGTQTTSGYPWRRQAT